MKSSGRTFDAIIVGAGNGLEPDGSLNAWYGNPAADIRTPGRALNAVSLLYATLPQSSSPPAAPSPGCDQGANALKIYSEAYEILAHELPWLTYYNAVVVVAANSNVEGWDPFAL